MHGVVRKYGLGFRTGFGLITKLISPPPLPLQHAYALVWVGEDEGICVNIRVSSIWKAVPSLTSGAKPQSVISQVAPTESTEVDSATRTSSYACQDFLCMKALWLRNNYPNITVRQFFEG